MKIVTINANPENKTELSGSINLTIAGGLMLRISDEEGGVEITLTAEDLAALKSAFK